MPEPTKIVKIADGDCITLAKACDMAKKSKNTIRGWVNKGKLTKYVTGLDKQNSPMLISRTELLVHLGRFVSPDENGKSKGGRPSTPTSSIAVLERSNREHAELNKQLQREIDLLKGAAEKHQEHLNDLRRAEQVARESMDAVVTANKTVIDDLKMQLERERERNEKLELRMQQMTVYFNMPWWKKWNATVPLLTG